MELIATYRVQLHREFGFDEAARAAAYLADLGVSHLYCSPYFQAAPGSTHGYDVVDPKSVNEELGGATGHAKFRETLAKAGMSQVLDIVPNHMAVGEQNPWWWDVLENGPLSLYADYFDIDWTPSEPKLLDKVLLPVLGDHYGKSLESGEIQLERHESLFFFRYFEQRFPLCPISLKELLLAAGKKCEAEELAFLAEAFGDLSHYENQPARYHRDRLVLWDYFDRLCRERPDVSEALDAVVSEFNSEPDTLDDLIEKQNYRLAYWRTAARELNYRRFFDITTLIGLRMDQETVFSDTHELILKWVSSGWLEGLRVDHPDGLADPEGYLRRLREACPNTWIVVEKILEMDEKLPRNWPVDGTTGYDFLNRAGGLFVDQDGEQRLTDCYARFIGENPDYHEMVREKKLLVVREILGSELNRLTEKFAEVCNQHRRHRDHTREELRETLEEVIACFPVYRTYVRSEAATSNERDARYVDEAIQLAGQHRPDLDTGLLGFLRELLLMGVWGELERDLVTTFQQVSSATMAKGVEDTTFYCYHRLISLNEVGGDPARFGFSVESFHEACRETQRLWPRAMLSSSTHDTKRSEDARVRIHLLSEMPELWEETVNQWAALNLKHHRNGFPDRNIEYFFYQTLAGTWPIETDRLLAYMEKATREAKVHTSWTDPNPDYDRAMAEFVRETLGDGEFISSLENFLAPLQQAWRVSSLAQTLIKLTAPGIPDIYQGTELWALNLVDPDNRRPVDYEARRQWLAQAKGFSVEEVLGCMEGGVAKLWLIWKTLQTRRGRAASFGADSTYEPLRFDGGKAKHAVGFVRGNRVATVVPRLLVGWAGDWGETTVELPPGRWRNELTEEEWEGGGRELRQVLGRFPVGLLVRKEDASE